MNSRSIAIAIILCLAAWLPLSAQQTSTSQSAGQQAPVPAKPADTDKPAAKPGCCCEHMKHEAKAGSGEKPAHSCCHGKDGDSAKSMPCCNGKDDSKMECCNRAGKDSKMAMNCCAGKDDKMCTKGGKGCCGKDEQSCCAGMTAHCEHHSSPS